MVEKIVGKFQKHAHFGFIIPENRSIYWWDFFVSEKNWKNAEDWDLVTWHVLAKSKWKKPEAKIVLIWKETRSKPKIIIWIYSEHKWDFWFVDTEIISEDEKENTKKWYFVFKKDNAWAKDWDKVEAVVKIFKGKEQAVISNILKNKAPLIIWEFKDEWKFWFVIPEKWTFTSDIFVAWQKKMDAKDWDIVSVQIIKNTGRRPEWIVRKILKK